MLIFAGAERVTGIAGGDRGWTYGDALFETMRVCRGQIHWWPAHWQRLTRGAQRLGIPLPDQSLVQHEVADLVGHEDGVLRLQVSRGVGGRGYAPPAEAMPTWTIALHPLPPVAPPTGIELRWCETRLALQPALAGIKHCNRLEHVLARAEWTPQTTAHEGLMCSTENDVVCATAANVFVLADEGWLTPSIDRCGVRGVCRDWVMGALDPREMRLGVTEVEAAQAVFLCNAVRGILPVARLGGRTWSPHPQLAALSRRLADEHPGFAPWSAPSSELS